MPVYSLTLTQLRERCRRAADMEGSEFVSDTELDALINGRIRDYVHLAAELEAEEHGISTHDAASVTGSTDLGPGAALNPPLYRILHVLRTSGPGASSSEPIRMERLPPEMRGRVKENTEAVNLRVEYIGSHVNLFNAGDSWSFVGDAEDFVVGYVAGKLLAKEESDPSAWIGIAADAERRLRGTLARAQYDAGFFPDDRVANGVGYYWRLNGNLLEIYRDSSREVYWP